MTDYKIKGIGSPPEVYERMHQDDKGAVPSARFGDKAEIVASPELVLKIAERLEEWLIYLAEQPDGVDASREAIAMAQSLISFLIKGSSSLHRAALTTHLCDLVEPQIKELESKFRD